MIILSACSSQKNQYHFEPTFSMVHRDLVLVQITDIQKVNGKRGFDDQINTDCHLAGQEAVFKISFNWIGTYSNFSPDPSYEPPHWRDTMEMSIPPHLSKLHSPDLCEGILVGRKLAVFASRDGKSIPFIKKIKRPEKWINEVVFLEFYDCMIDGLHAFEFMVSPSELDFAKLYRTDNLWNQ